MRNLSGGRAPGGALAARLPAPGPAWLRLLPGPSPVRRLESLAGGAERLLKDDGVFADGSKLRKLEWLLGEAIAAGARRIVTFGDEGGAHLLAVARQARAAGLEPVLFGGRRFAVPGTVADRCAAELARTGARRIRLPLPIRLAVEVALVGAARGGKLGRTAVVPGGGSNATGCLGAIDAAIELADQLASPPEELFVAAGSCGMAAGLVVGLALVGAPTVVRAVDASSPLHPSRRRLRRLVRVTVGRLRDLGVACPSPAEERWSLVESDRRGPVRDAQASAARAAEGLLLDERYTAPAFAAFLERARARPDLRLLFWNTCGRSPVSSGGA